MKYCRAPLNFSSKVAPSLFRPSFCASPGAPCADKPRPALACIRTTPSTSGSSAPAKSSL
eukprot:2262509-Pyramimonas_sp.AAC.1